MPGPVALVRYAVESTSELRLATDCQPLSTRQKEDRRTGRAYGALGCMQSSTGAPGSCTEHRKTYVGTYTLDVEVLKLVRRFRRILRRRLILTLRRGVTLLIKQSRVTTQKLQ
jgi:hypothetical protein